MPSHKRAASETLLPLRAPKQARTTTYHPLGGNSSPSQNEALLTRWTRLGTEFMHVLRDTIISIASLGKPSDADALPFSAPSQRHVEDELQEHNSMPSPPPSPSPPPPPPRATTSTRQLPPRPAIPNFPARQLSHQTQVKPLSTSAPVTHGTHQRVQTQQPNAYTHRPILTKYASMQGNAVASTSKSAMPPVDAPKASESSIRSAVTQTYPEVGAALAETSTHRRKKSVKKYIEREHIHAKQVSQSCARACPLRG
ncbi:hypothetical protein BC628DRAFT_1379813 [Trametes gibbosa]|nr:hypothetical protein BC628DRAFT_1379813 [Trametes gibbosa]